MRVRPPGAAVTGLLALAAAASACSTVQSKDLRTSGLHAAITVTVSPAGAEVDVHLSAGGLTSVQLDRGDHLTATGGGRQVALQRRHVLGVDTYDGVLEGVTAPGTEVVVALHRGSSDTDAPDSHVQLPGTVHATVPGRAFSRAHDAVPVTVSSGAGAVRVGWNGSCAVPDASGVELTGPPFVLPSGTLPSYAASAKQPRRCQLTLTVWRVESGHLDGAYDGGSITAQRPTTVTMASKP